MIFNKSKNIVTISINNESLNFFYWKCKSNRIYFQAFYKYKFQNNEIINLVIFNPTQLEIVIESFLNHYKIHKSEIYINFDSNLCDEYLRKNVSNFHDNTDYQEICLSKDIYYIVGIKQFLLFQYKLIFSKLHLNLVKISSNILSLINIRNRKSFEINDIETFKANLKNTTDIDLKNYIRNSDVFDNLNKTEICESLGLFIKKLNE